MTVLALGHLGPPPVGNDPRRRLLALADAGLIVVVGTRLPGGWDCGVVARRRPDGPRRIVLTDDQIEAAAGQVDADPVGDPDGYAMAWLAHVRTTSPAGRVPAVARLLAEQLREPATVLVELDARVAHRLAVASGARLVGLRRIVHRLVLDGLLVADSAGDDGWGRYRLRIPRSSTSATATPVAAGPVQPTGVSNENAR